ATRRRRRDSAPRPPRPRRAGRRHCADAESDRALARNTWSVLGRRRRFVVRVAVVVGVAGFACVLMLAFLTVFMTFARAHAVRAHLLRLEVLLHLGWKFIGIVEKPRHLPFFFVLHVLMERRHAGHANAIVDDPVGLAGRIVGHALAFKQHGWRGI